MKLTAYRGRKSISILVKRQQDASAPGNSMHQPAKVHRRRRGLRITPRVVIDAMAGQRTGSAVVAGADVFEPPIGGRCDVAGVEIDQVRRVDDTMRIMTRRARRLFVHDMQAMGTEALVAHQLVAVMTFVTHGVCGRGFGLKIRDRKVAFQNRAVNRTVRAIGARRAGFGTRIAVMTIGAIHDTIGGPRGDEARHAVRIFSNRFHRMKTLVGGGKLQPCICLRVLPRHERGTAREAVGMTTETQFIFLLHRLDDAARRAHANRSGNRAGRSGSDGGCRRGSVGIMTIGADNMARRGIDRIFGWRMRAAVQRDGMNARLLKIGGNVLLGRRAAMADEAVLLRHIRLQQVHPGARLVVHVTIFAAERGHRRRLDGDFGRDRRGLLRGKFRKDGLRHRRGRNGVRGRSPRIRFVANQTQRGSRVVNDEKTAETIVVGIMTGGALEAVLRVHFHRRRAQMRRVVNVGIVDREIRIIDE